MPLRAYRRNAGWLFGHTLLEFTHVGRRTGEQYQTVAMVLHYEPTTRQAVICAAWGPGTDWVRNLRVAPATRVRIGRYWDTPEHRFLTADDSFAIADVFRRAHPSGLRLVITILGWGDLRDDAAVRDFIHTHPFVAFRPATPARF